MNVSYFELRHEEGDNVLVSYFCFTVPKCVSKINATCPFKQNYLLDSELAGSHQCLRVNFKF